MPSFTVSTLNLPTDATDPDWVAVAALRNAFNHELLGGPQWDATPQERLQATLADTENVTERLLLRADGEPVGCAMLTVNVVDDPEMAFPWLYLSPAWRGRGLARRLVDALRQAVEARPELKRLQAWVDVPDADGETISPPSRHGALPADDPGVRLTLGLGFELGHLERVSRYDLANPLIDPREALAQALEHAGDDYEVATFAGMPPEADLAGIAVLKQRMSLDAPSGALTEKPTVWDADRARRRYEATLQTAHLFVAVARHASGEVVGLNELTRPRGNPEAFVDQNETIVLPEHRGHRLGMAVKAANILSLRRAMPAAEAILTWNAPENAPMLAVNEALGFRRVWQEAGFELALEGRS